MLLLQRDQTRKCGQRFGMAFNRTGFCTDQLNITAKTPYLHSMFPSADYVPPSLKEWTKMIELPDNGAFPSLPVLSTHCVGNHTSLFHSSTTFRGGGTTTTARIRAITARRTKNSRRVPAPEMRRMITP